MKYCSDNPYPEVKVESINKDYAKILLQDYAGEISEETAIHTYLFQHLSFDDEFSKIIEKIAIVEMRHLEMIGKCINLLGLDPVFKTYESCNELMIPWTSDFVNYTTNYEMCLLDNIKAEMKAIEMYKKHIMLINDKYIKKLLERIIEDEELHLKIFNDLYKQKRV